MPPELSNDVKNENNEMKSIIDSKMKLSLDNTIDDLKLNKQIIKLNNNLNFNNINIEEDVNRDSICSINDDHDNNRTNSFSSHVQAKKDEDKNALELNKSNNDLESESQPEFKVQTEKNIFSDLFRNKILKINNINVCSDFINYFDVEKFNEFINAFKKIKIFKFSLENIKIPPFRNVTKNSFDRVEITKKNTISSLMNPIIRTKKRFLFVIWLLILIGILLIVFVIILLIR